MPGQPPANVEYRRRKHAPFRSTLLFSVILSASKAPKELNRHSLGFWDSGEDLTRGELKLDNSSLQPDHCRMGSVAGAQFGEDVLDSPLDGLLGDRELIRDLLIGISGCDQAQHVDFCRRQRIIRRMLGDFVRGFGRKSLFQA